MSFHQSIAFAITRTDKIVKTAVETNSAGASIRNNWSLPTNEFIVFCMGGSKRKSVLYFSYSTVKV